MPNSGVMRLRMAKKMAVGKMKEGMSRIKGKAKSLKKKYDIAYEKGQQKPKIIAQKKLMKLGYRP